MFNKRLRVSFLNMFRPTIHRVKCRHITISILWGNMA